MRLARTHLQYIGSSSYQYFAAIAAEVIKYPLRPAASLSHAAV
jgi:hypothetical protein